MAILPLVTIPLTAGWERTSNACALAAVVHAHAASAMAQRRERRDLLGSCARAALLRTRCTEME